jgi:PKD repeat protein
MRPQSSGRSDPGPVRSWFFITVALLLFCGCAVMPALSQVQPPVIVRPPATLVSEMKIPVAGFTADVTEGPVPLTVRFTDTSLNTPTSWSWDLDGDGRSDSQASDPEYTYSVPGSYTVTLTVTNRAGTDTAVNQGFITVRKEVPAPVAGFSASPVRGTKPLTVRFTDESRNNPTAWWWDFDNDGETDSREKDPLWTYPEPGVYTVRLTVSSDAGKDEEVREAAIIVLVPVTASRTPLPTTVVPTPSTPPTPVPLSPPAKPGAPPGIAWLPVLIIMACLITGAYLLMRARSSRQSSDDDPDLHFELTGGIQYGEDLSDAGEDLLDSIFEEMEERGEDEHGRT